MEKKVIILSIVFWNFIVCATDYLSEGNDYYRQGDCKKAIELYKKALDNDENPALGWFNLGNAQYQCGTFYKAVSCYELAVSHAPDFTRGWKNLGTLYYELHDYGACISALQKAMLLDKSDPVVYLLLASAYKDMENYSLSTIYLEMALEIDSTNYDAILMLYEMARLTGDSKEAFTHLMKYPEKGARFYDVKLLLGELYLEKNDTSSALAAFRFCTHYKPQRKQAWIELVKLLNQMNVAYTALEEALKALEIHTSFVDLALLAGSIAFNGGYYDKAEKFFTIAYRDGHPDGVVGLGNLTTVYNQYGDNSGVMRINSILRQKN